MGTTPRRGHGRAGDDVLVPADPGGIRPLGPVEAKNFAHWQDVNRETLVDIVGVALYVASLDEAAREARLDKVRALYDDYGRGHDGMQLAYRTECFRAQVIDRDEGPSTDPGDDASHDGPIISDGTDTDMLLIDFR